MKILNGFLICTLFLCLCWFPAPTKSGMLTNSPDEIPISNESPKQQAEDIPRCNRELLINYGLKGVAEPVITNHQFCPAITQNCCTNADEVRSMEMWSSELKPIVERYIHSIR